MRFIKSLLFLFILLLFSIQAPTVAAQENRSAPGGVGSTMPVSIMPPDTNPILGHEHAYSVLFRGNGDAVVSMRASFTNDKATSSNTISFRIPRVEPRRVSAFQILRDPECIRYKEFTPYDTPGQQPMCLQYQEPNYFRIYGAAKYQKAATLLAGDTLTITLPQSISPSKTGSILVVFSAAGYAKKNIFGGYDYTFETLKSEESAIATISLGISVDTDLHLAGAKGNVNYRFSDTEVMSMSAQSNKAAMASPQMDQLYSQLGYGMITKTASRLEPLESYSVKGRYADSLLKLYAKGMLIAVMAFVGGLAVLFFLGKAAFKALIKPRPQGSSPSSTDSVILLGGSFLSAALIAGYTAGLFFLRNTIQQVVSYQLVGVILILATVISIGIYGLLLITPAMVVGVRRGIVWGLGTLGLTVFFLIINTVILVVVLTLLYSNAGGPMPPIYNMMRGSGASTNAERMGAAISGSEETRPSNISPNPLKSPK